VGLLFQYPEEQLFEDTVYERCGLWHQEPETAPGGGGRKGQKGPQQVNLDLPPLKTAPLQSERRGEAAGGHGRGLVMNPELIILDEPTAGLDPRGRREILAGDQGAPPREGLTVVIVSHSMEDVAWLAEHWWSCRMGRSSCRAPGRSFCPGRELREAGLAVPEVNRVLKRPERSGFDVDTGSIPVRKRKRRSGGFGGEEH
jgi:energy-coupling factor transport system ATP-binding protein